MGYSNEFQQWIWVGFSKSIPIATNHTKPVLLHCVQNSALFFQHITVLLRQCSKEFLHPMVEFMDTGRFCEHEDTLVMDRIEIVFPGQL